MTWASIEDLEEFLGRPADARMAGDLDAALAWCNNQRPDLDPATDAGPGIRRAVVTYAGLLYRERATPQGFATYSDLDIATGDTHSAMMNIYRLLGTRKPVAR